ncbi:hypothetical protein ASPBRDRAFT_673802 [Aspergillus brasiliensis CBS 101740]|uniref:Amino acid permease/ SLC12A domain-containing protein n=1 Tax=Aspergillus brasiliensis (strain CBS 101740 / IMI 381727 / IBT 21946) TaxID=767769 RepID=A0A1L9U1F0_ASPBC|nr:hypothetical protein ASPBRDRAFT_673802 [Aspergillus brasiliensis CBS 101740]
MAVGEAENPRKTIPTAIRKVFYRILFSFVFTVSSLALPSTINAVLLTVILSSANSNVCTGSRTSIG